MCQSADRGESVLAAAYLDTGSVRGNALLAVDLVVGDVVEGGGGWEEREKREGIYDLRVAPGV